MTKYENLLKAADNSNVFVTDKFNLSDTRFLGLYCNGIIALNKNMIEKSEKTCVLAEELGHHYTTVGNILDQSKTENRKQERRARIWAYKKLITLSDLIQACKKGCQNSYEIADYLEITESFLAECLNYYRERYGVCTHCDNYIIYFEPLEVVQT